jgi:GGDEF domain-containing protein
MIERVLTAVCKRLAEAIPQAARIVRWQKDSLSVVLPPALVNDIESDAVRACAGDYICMDDGSRRNLYVEAAAAGLCSQPGEDADEFLARLDHIRIPAAAQTRGPI